MAAVEPPEQRHARGAAGGERDDNCDGGRKRHDRPPQRVERDIDRAVARIADRQKGNLTFEQLLAAGLGKAGIQNWIRRGRLYPRHRGVYALAHTATPPFSEEMAAVLACKPRALVSHASAAYVWGFGPQPGRIHVTTVGRQARQRARIRVHRTTSLAGADLKHHEGIPLTSPARALLEIAADIEEERELERALHEALALKLVTVAQVRAVLKRYSTRRGAARLAELVDGGCSGEATRSGGELALLRHLRKSGLPRPRVNAEIDRWQADFYWPEAQLVVEVDGSDFHSSRRAIERDHRKDLALKAAGIEVLRFTGRQIKREIELVLVAIAQEYTRRTYVRISSVTTPP